LFRRERDPNHGEEKIDVEVVINNRAASLKKLEDSVKFQWKKHQRSSNCPTDAILRRDQHKA